VKASRRLRKRFAAARRPGPHGRGAVRLFLFAFSFDTLQETDMNKTDLVATLAERASLNKVDAAKLVDTLFDPSSGIIAQTLKQGQKVQISGFGTFESRRRKGRTGRNPRTGEEIMIPPSTTASFRAGKALKDTVG
jgi:DNA-binding protein HU-beta